ncbi:MAG: hypothetical protein HYW23_02010 [Candidatus Aenigmarchaeota archaeon]|nr:hypothetical protein [Candidatus Aenigmarchaeota archaeon]
MVACAPVQAPAPTQSQTQNTANKPVGTPTIAPIRVGHAKEYFNGKPYDVNVLEVDLPSTECDKLQKKYQRTARRIIIDNVQSVLRSYPSASVFEQGFPFSGRLSLNPSSAYDGLKNSYIRVSRDDESTLLKIGQDIYNGACLDPEQRTYR